MPDKDRYQATSKVSHHETAAQRSLDSSVDRAQRTLAHCGMARQSRPTSTATRRCTVDEWQQRAPTSETFIGENEHVVGEDIRDAGEVERAREVRVGRDRASFKSVDARIFKPDHEVERCKQEIGGHDPGSPVRRTQ